MTATATVQYAAGTWDIDAVHSEVGFAVRHMMVSKVRGRFRVFSGEIRTGAQAEPERASPPPRRSTGATSGSTSSSRWRAAASLSARRWTST